MARFATCVFVLASAFLAGCATPTAYQPKSWTGGYQERAVGKNRWYVEFYGNGRTTRDTVMAYWLHRCAELTMLKGYDYFVLISKTPQARGVPDIDIRYASGDDDPAVLHAKGGGGGYVPVYVPGGTVTTWSARGVIELHIGSADSEERPHFVANELLDKLKPLVQEATASGKNVVLPKDMFVASEQSDAPPAARG